MEGVVRVVVAAGFVTALIPVVFAALGAAAAVLDTLGALAEVFGGGGVAVVFAARVVMVFVVFGVSDNMGFAPALRTARA